MSTQPPDPDPEEPAEEVVPVESDDPLDDPAMAPVYEGGGGEAEGFELAERDLIRNATEGELDGTDRILEDAGEAEAEEDRGVYGEPDEEHSSEDEDDSGR
jgi:hypothetical protein